MAPAALKMRGCFVAGTDTEVGKTWVASGVVHRWRSAGHRVAVLKPVAAGCEDHGAGLRNADAEQLLAASGSGQDYASVNPYAFAPPVSPHLAARDAGVQVDVPALAAHAADLLERHDRLVVEGAGGWLCPVGESVTLEDLAVALQLPVLLVVGLRLGCLNHALLSASRIVERGLPLAGWVGTPIDPGMARVADNVATLTDRLPAPCLGVLPRLERLQPQRLAAALSGP